MKWLPLYFFLFISCNGSVYNKPDGATTPLSTNGIINIEPEPAFTVAIANYIHAVHDHTQQTFDTLFFLLHPEFPDIQLPPTIENTAIVVEASGEIDKKRSHRKTLYAVNLFGWVNRTSAEFIFVTFNPGYQHDFDCFINYDRDTISGVLKQKELRLEDYLYSKVGNLESIKVYKNGQFFAYKPLPKQK